MPKKKRKKISSSKEEEEDADLLRTTPLRRRKAKKSPQKAEFEFSIDRILADKKTKSDDFDDLPEEEKLELSEDELDKEIQQKKSKLEELATELPQVQEKKISRLFPNWQQKLPKPTMDVEQGKTGEQILLLILSQDALMREELIRGGWILNCFQNTQVSCPANILEWLFFSVAYAEVSEVDRALNVLEGLLLKQENPPSLAIGGSLPTDQSVLERTDNQQKEWTPTVDHFASVFNSYGAQIGRDFTYVTTSTKYTEQERATFPIRNFCGIIRYLDLCVKHRTRQFSKDHTFKLIRLLMGFVLDPCLGEARIFLESAIGSLLSRFSVVDWKTYLKKLCKSFYYVAKTGAFPENCCELAAGIPNTLDRGRQLRSHFCYYAICKLTRAKLTQMDYSQYPPFSEICNRMTSLNLKKEKNFFKVCTLISLLDLCIFTNAYIKAQASKLGQLRDILSHLKSQFRDVGYDIAKTKVKDGIVLLMTKLALFSTTKPIQTQLSFAKNFS